MKPSTFARTATALALASLATACVADDPDSAAELGGSEAAIVGGVPAFSRSLDAVGSINKRRASGRFTQHCTGTLIAPTVVLTAQHCIEAEGPGEAPPSPAELQFAIGFDSTAPRRVVPVRSVAAERTIDEGGFVRLGTDVAVLHLAEPVTDIAPLRIAPFDDGRAGQRFTLLGYGVQDTDDSPSDPFFSKRLAGTHTLRGPSHGKILELMFGSFENFVSQLPDLPDFEGVPEADLRDAFDFFSLLDGEEAVFGGAPGDADACFGDSGGPMIKNVGGKLTIFGVTSGGFASARQGCGNGAIFAVFGPASRAFVEREIAAP